MNIYEQLAEQLLTSMDEHRHMPPEPVSGTVRGEMAVLRLLSREEEGQSAGAIAEMLRMTTSRIAAVLNALEKKGLIVRSADPNDKRRVLVILTDAGRSTCMMRRNEAKAHLTRLLSRLSQEDAAAFVRISSQLFSVPHENPPIKEV